MQTVWTNAVFVISWLILIYFIVLNSFYLLLIILAAFYIREYNSAYKIYKGADVPGVFRKPFSIAVPAYNEEATIADSIKSLLALDYGEYEVVVVNDGSKDKTMDVLINEFQLEEVDIPYIERYPSKKIKQIFFSKKHPKLVVINKENGGKADALNCASNFARYPYVCAIDADSMLEKSSMDKIMRKFAADPNSITVGGIVRLANGSVIKDSAVTQVKTPNNILEIIQIVEYLRAFFFGRLGFVKMNILMIVSGAFGVFRQDILQKVNGWNTKSLCEDMELVFKIQAYLKEEKTNLRVSFAPDPVCWTQAPDSLKGLSTQRGRWQRGTMQTLLEYKRMFFNPKFKAVGMIGYPYFLIFEALSAPIEFFGYLFFIIGYIFGIINLPFFILFTLIAVFWGMCLSVLSLALEEFSYRRYSRRSDLIKLFLGALIENFGYRQIHSFWRLKGMVKYLTGTGGGWGTIKRKNF